MTMHGPVRACPRAKPHIAPRRLRMYRFKVFCTVDLRPPSFRRPLPVDPAYVWREDQPLMPSSHREPLTAQSFRAEREPLPPRRITSEPVFWPDWSLGVL